MKKRNLSPVITGKTIDEVKKETNSIVSKLWTELNALSEKVNSQSSRLFKKLILSSLGLRLELGV